MASGGGGILRRDKDKHLLINDFPASSSATDSESPTKPTLVDRYSPFNRIGSSKNADNVQVSYSNLAAQMESGSFPSESPNSSPLKRSSVQGSDSPVHSTTSKVAKTNGTNNTSSTGDAALDISRNSSSVSVESSRWSVFGARGERERGSERSWTPSAVRDRIQNWPHWLNIKTFVGAMCVLICVHGALSSGYVMAIITTIEKRFEIRSRTSGLVVSSYEFGSLLSVLFVSYFGSQGHVPRYIGVGCLLLACGSILWTVPHFIAMPPHLENNTAEDLPDMCVKTGFVFKEAVVNPGCDSGSSVSTYVFILILAQVLVGIGGSPIFTLGTTYIDNHVSKENSSVYLAFMYVSMAFGPVCGYLLGALMLSRYVDPPAPDNITQDNPSWIGLWWGGFILLGILYFLSGIPFFGFPRKLPTENPPPPASTSNAAAASPSSVSGYGKSLKNIPFSVFRLLTNSVYMLASLNACMDLGIVSGFTVFLPKYLETQFNVSKSQASILTGGVAIPGACIGIFLGGWVLKRFKLQLKGVATLVASINCVCLVGLVFFYFLGCNNLKLAGVFNPYDKSLLPIDPLGEVKQANLTIDCNRDCHCKGEDYEPVCGDDGKTYFSPCFGGCLEYSVRDEEQTSIRGAIPVKKVTSFTNCSCITRKRNGTEGGGGGGGGEAGICKDACDMKVPFLIYLFLITLIASNNQMPLVMVTLRAVSEEEKAFALGVQVVLLRLLAYIPAPILFGSVIDTACLKWKPTDCGDDGSTCLLYDVKYFRERYISIALVLKAAGAALSLLLVWSIRRRGRGAEPFSAPITMSEIAHRLGDVDNLHIRTCPAGMRSWMSDDSLYSRPRSPRRHQKTLSC